jgi:hypothetical protein
MRALISPTNLPPPPEKECSRYRAYSQAQEPKIRFYSVFDLDLYATISEENTDLNGMSKWGWGGIR